MHEHPINGVDVNTAREHHGASGTLAQLKLRKPAEKGIRGLAAALLASSDRPDRRELVRFSAMDPLLAVWILKKANSFYYGLRSTVDNISHAIDVLDPSVVAGMFADTPTTYIASSESGEITRPDSLTRHSIATALLAHWLDNRSGKELGCAFTAGLMHDIGKHVFALNFPDEAAKIYSTPSLWDSFDGADLLSVEQLAFGLDHTEVGEFVARKMHFPEPLTEVLRSHNNPSSLPPYHRVFRMSRIVNAASLGATGLGYAAGIPVSWERCVQDKRWDKLIEEGVVHDRTKNNLVEEMRLQESKIESFLDLECPLPSQQVQPRKNGTAPARNPSPRTFRSGPPSGIGRASHVT